MGSKKNIVIIALLMALTIGLNVAVADNSNNLTQVDVKKSSVADTIDVTFYTTDTNTNTVVSKKSGNRYVVLLPNVTSNSSVTPSIGGLKDVISNVEVKHVNDGMGGYTKVTFDTTKPITIKTHNKKSNPISQAQKDSQNIIAKNNQKPAVSQTTKPQATAEKPVTNTASKPVANTQPKTNTSNTQPAVAKTVSTPKLVPIEFPKISLIKPEKIASKPVSNAAQSKTQSKVQPKIQPKVVEQQKPQVQPAVQPKVKVNDDFVNSTYQPKMKFDENGKRTVDLEPRVSHSIVQEDVNKTAPVVAETPSTSAAVQEPVQPVKTVDDKKQKNTPWGILLGAILAAGGVFYLVFDAIRHSNQKDASRLESFFSLSSQNQAKRRRREYYDIVNDESLSWQEKYKRYVEKEQENAPKKSSNDASYVTNIGANKSALIMPKLDEEKPKTSDKLAQTIKKPEKSHNEVVREKLQAKISQMEHSLAQTPTLKEPVEYSNEVRSEDKAIMNKISDVKLKSFAKPRTLKQTQRPLSNSEEVKSPNKDEYKEGQFVKLNDTPLSVSKRSSASTEMTSSEIIGTANKYLTNNGEMKMSKENENYLVSSLGEYMSILDAEEERKSKMTLTEALSQVKSEPDVTSKSGITNPISRSDDRPLRALHGGLVVKSGYNIDSERGIYLVNVDGVSALIGRIKGNTFMLKKFDKVIDKQLQVRPENDHVYIVKAGSYKCLVDVASDRMGTLIEI